MPARDARSRAARALLFHARMARSSLLCSVALATPLLCAHAQTAPVQREYSRQFQSPPGTVDLQGQRNAPEVSRFDGTSIEDDAFGEQAILKREERPRAFSAYAEIGAFVTNNVALAKRNAQQDVFLVATTAASFAHRFSHAIRFDAGAQASVFRYDEVRELDFQSTDLSAGVTWTAPVAGGVDVSARYVFTDLTTAERTREFYKNHAILLGVQKTIPFSRAQLVYFGASSLWSFADPKPAGRDEYSAYAGYRAQLTRRMDADLYYRFGHYVYRHGGGRRDENHTLSLSLHYRPTEWLSFSASSFFGTNRSNRDAFDYEVLNAGVGVQCSMQF